MLLLLNYLSNAIYDSLFPLAPCRVLDTRNPPGSPPISGTLDVNVLGSNCNVPPESEAYVFNATVVPPATEKCATADDTTPLRVRGSSRLC